MDILTISDRRVDIYLSGMEVDKIFGGYGLIDYDIPECRIKIHSLIAAAIPKSLLPLDCERALIEVKPKEFGCVISFTKIYAKAKKYRAVKYKKPITLFFENSEDLICSVCILKDVCAEKSELYSRGANYAIISNLKSENARCMAQLREYCRVSRKETDAAKVREYWRQICKRGAISRLYDSFLK
ncbi:MAG: hypothetical protein J5852_07900 [Clostridia bacterium]|nr:hypothetical protein [Clostridia bacterium]